MRRSVEFAPVEGDTDRISELPCSESGQKHSLAGGVDRFGGVPVAKRSQQESLPGANAPQRGGSFERVIQAA
jgi:hypothetical protein